MKWLDCHTGDDPVSAFVRDAAPHIGNVHTRMRVLDTGTRRWPVSENSGEARPGNCYVVSPCTAYSRYADEEIVRLGRPWLTWPLRLLARGLGLWLQRGGLDRLVTVNNWLLSTNVYPSGWDGSDLPALTRFLAHEYPDHALAWRSLNRTANGPLMARLEALGYLPVPSRQVYLFDGRDGDAAPFLRHHNTRLDAALWRRTPYRVVDGATLGPEGLQRAEALYNRLYLDKYSRLNPQFSARWLAAGLQGGWLTLRALQQPDGRMDGVVGWFGNGGWLTAPVVGYDTALPASLGLYRLITRLCLQETAQRRSRLNFSSGAAHFKRLRGGEPAIEYTLVLVDHLPRARQRVWRALQATLDRVAVPLMRRWQL
jgi:hypothetical protein